MTALFSRRAVVQVAGRDVSGLRVRFDVARNLKNVPSSAEIKIYNLSEASRQAVSAQPDVPVLVLAGYRDQEPHAVFLGRLRRVTTVVEGADLVTTIASADGVPTTAPRVNLSLAAGSDLGAALEQITALSERAGIGRGNTAGIARSLQGRRVGAGGLALSGSISAALDTVLEQAGIEWSVQDGQLQLLERGGARQVRAAVLSSDTGLVSSPSVDERGNVKVRSLIAPGLTPGLLVQLQSRLVSGFYRVESARYTGDTEGPEWYLEIELKPARAR